MSDISKEYEVSENDGECVGSGFEKNAKTISFHVGWNGDFSISLKHILDITQKEFPDLSTSEIGLTINQESEIIVHNLKDKKIC